MESRLFYDIRAGEVPSGVFDLRSLRPAVRKSLHRLVVQRAQPLGLSGAHLTDAGYIVVREPANGPNTHWNQQVFELQRNVEIALGRRIQMLTKIERIYVMNFPIFTPEHWQALAQLFSQLPEWQGAQPYPHWFGNRASPPPYIWAQITPKGLQVRGLLSAPRWAGWDTWLRKNMHGFPLIVSEG